MIAVLLFVLLVLSIAAYCGATLTVAVEAPVSSPSWERVSYWAERARYYETGPCAGWERGQYGGIRPCVMAHDVTGCTETCV